MLLIAPLFVFAGSHLQAVCKHQYLCRWQAC
jgi:hypothetical protein